MITTYLLQDCKHCKQLLKYIKKNPNVNICLIMVSKEEIPLIRKTEPRIKEFPVAFTGNPKNNGFPYKNSHIISGSQTILDTFKNNFGDIKRSLKGSNIKIDYLNDNKGNISSLNNIREHRNNCFGNTCHVMDRPYGPVDNQFILQGYQTPCAIPKRSDLSIRNSSYFGTTPGTNMWKSQRKIWPPPSILVDGNNYKQNQNGNKYVHMNVPRTYKDDYLNRKIWNPLKLNNFGTKGIQENLNKFISAPVNQTAPFLTYAAGSNGVSRVTGHNFYPEQIPIQKSPKNSYISGNIKEYVKDNYDKQKLLAGGLNSHWSINAQGINNFGYKMPPPPPQKVSKTFGNKNPWELTRTVSGNGNNQNQYFQRDRFVKNGNSYGKLCESKLPYKIKTKSILPTKLRNKLPTKLPTKLSHKSPRETSNKKMKFTSPLGIEISFN